MVKEPNMPLTKAQAEEKKRVNAFLEAFANEARLGGMDPHDETHLFDCFKPIAEALEKVTIPTLAAHADKTGFVPVSPSWFIQSGIACGFFFGKRYQERVAMEKLFDTSIEKPKRGKK